jgi:signal transduction histidine kinase/CheY-like chemotaxis protein
MSRIHTLYKFVLSFLVFFYASISLFAMQTEQDTLTLIQKYRQETRSAINVQDYNSAIQSLSKANKLISSIDDNVLKADVLLASIDLHYNLQNYTKAGSESLNVIHLLEKTQDKRKLANAYYHYGLVLTQTGKFKEAGRYFNDADEMFGDLNDERNQSNILLGRGILELKQGNPKSALNYFEASIPLFQSFGFKYQEAFSQLNKAEALIQLDPLTEVNLELAKNSLAIANGIIGSNSFAQLEIDSYKIASQLALKDGDIATAERQLNLYAKKKDSIQHIYINIISKGVDIESNLGDLTNIIEEQQSDLDKNKKSINFSKLTNGLSIALIIILSLLTLSLYKNNNLRAKANELLQDKNNELMLAKEKAEKASLAKAQFLSTITHELRTPLYAVTGLTHLLMEDNPKENQKEHLNSLKFSGEYLLSLINNILDLNKLEANKVEVEKTSFNLKKRINDVLVALKKSADDKKNKLLLEFDESIPSSLAGDPLKLSQILINLIGNSVKFTQNGEVVVRVQNVDQKNDKVRLHFEIEDNGVGISKKKQKSIFETFSQGSLQINRKFGGTGLGLSIVKNLLELMNSKIYLESQLGKGSKFWFDINFNISEEIKEEINPKNIIYTVDYAALENKYVLVVEDNKINQMITKKILEKNKMKCLVADNGMDAIKMVKENDFDVVLMDIHMPGISGIEATQKIREFNTQLPIIALTAVTIDENLDEFYRAGFNEIIPKPFKPEEFFEKIYRTLEGNKQTAISS